MSRGNHEIFLKIITDASYTIASNLIPLQFNIISHKSVLLRQKPLPIDCFEYF